MTEDASAAGTAAPTTSDAATPRLCAFPGCPRPAAAPAFASGRPPAYCDDDGHTATTAFRERRRLKAAATGTPPVDDLRPVETATQRAAALRGQVAEVGEHLVGQMRILLEELATLSDPEAAAVQIESVTSEAGEQVAAATARAARADRAARTAEIEREQADTAAEEALARLEEVSADLEGTRQGWRAEVADLAAAQIELVREHQAALDTAAATAAAQVEALQEEHQQALARVAQERIELVQAHDRAMEQALETAAAREDVLTRRAEEQLRAAEQALREADTARQAAEGDARTSRSNADRAEAEAVALRAQLAQLSEQERQARDDAAQMRTDLAVTRTERDAALTDVAREREAADQRVREVREVLTSEVQHLRAELEALREAARQQRDGTDDTGSTVGERAPRRRGRAAQEPASDGPE